jgi:ketosteroid isomerase-like protein
MPIRVRAALVAAIALAALSACAPRAPDTAKMIEQAKALDARFITAFNAGDVEGVMATYDNSAELVSYPPDELEALGFAAVKAGFAKSFAASKGAKLELVDPHYRALGDAVIGYGHWKMVMPGANGAAQIELTGRFTDVKAERNGKWVYLIDHASVPFGIPEAPPPPAPPPPPPAQG